MEQRSGRIVRTGFALPTVLIASVVMLAVLSASVAAATSTRAALLNQRYDSLATYAAESGMQMAKECMAAGFTTWSEPLRPGGTCAGLASACSDPSCYLVNEPNVRSSFEVSPPTTDGDISTVRSQGIVEQLRTTGSGVIRSYSSAMKQVIVDTGGGGEPIYATVENYAGSGLSGSTNGAVASARFNRPYGVTIDSAGNIYISEISNHAIRKITTDGTVSTFAGEVGDPDDDDGFGT